MSLLDDRAEYAHQEAAWQEFLRETEATGSEGPGPLACRWFPDPAAPDHVICVWEASPRS